MSDRNLLALGLLLGVILLVLWLRRRGKGARSRAAGEVGSQWPLPSFKAAPESLTSPEGFPLEAPEPGQKPDARVAEVMQQLQQLADEHRRKS
jgi:hypothetical protein